MRKTLAATLALGLLLPGRAAFCSDLPILEQRKTLRILAVVAGEESLFVSSRPGPPGFDIEVLEAFARLHDLRVEVVPLLGWQELIPALRQDKGDLIAGGFTDTESRRRWIDFTSEVFPTRSVVMTRKPTPAIDRVADLKAGVVGTIKGTFMEEELAEAGITSIDNSIPIGGLPGALKTGRIGAAVDGLEAALIAMGKDPELQLGAFIGRPRSLAYGVRKQDQALLKALNDYISNFRRTPTWNRLVVKYFGEAAVEILRKARG